MSAWFVVPLVGLLIFVLSVIWRERRWEAAQRRIVKVGDLWEYIGPETHPRRKTRGVYLVVRANVNTEAGPDSWVMQSLDGRELYMHRSERVRPDSNWILAMRDGRPMRRETDVRRSLAAGVPAILTWFCAGLIIAVVTMLPACSVFDSACTKTLPVLATAGVLLDDAQLRVDQAEAIVVKLRDPDARDKALTVIAELRAGLVAAGAALHAASTACTAPDVGTAFAAFVTAWPKILPFVSLFGGGGESQVGTPLVVAVHQ